MEPCETRAGASATGRVGERFGGEQEREPARERERKRGERRVKRGRERRRERSVRGVTACTLNVWESLWTNYSRWNVFFFSFLCLPRIPGEPLSLRIAAAATAAVAAAVAAVVVAVAVAAVNLSWPAILAGNRQPEEDQVRSEERKRAGARAKRRRLGGGGGGELCKQTSGKE